VFYYSLVDGTILFLRIFPPFFSFALKSLVFYLFFVGLGQRSKISLGSVNVSCMAYISSYVLIINFFLFTFFWVSVDNPVVIKDSSLENNPLIVPFDFIEWVTESLSEENKELFKSIWGFPVPTKEDVFMAKLAAWLERLND